MKKNNNWRRKYHKREHKIKRRETNEEETSDSESDEIPDLEHDLINLQHRPSIWLSVVCYTAALTILLAIFSNLAYLFTSEEPPTDSSNNLPEEGEVNFEFSPQENANIEEALEEIVQQPTRARTFQENLNSLYLVILGAVAGYLEAVRRAHNNQ